MLQHAKKSYPNFQLKKIKGARYTWITTVVFADDSQEHRSGIVKLKNSHFLCWKLVAFLIASACYLIVRFLLLGSSGVARGGWAAPSEGGNFLN